MKIVFVYGNMQRGGAQRVISCLAAYCAQMGDAVTILTLDGGGSDYELDPGVRIVGLNVSGDSANKLESAKRFLTTERKLRTWMKAEKPDAVLAFSTKMAMRVQLARGQVGPALICSERANPAFRAESAATRMERRLLKKAEGFIFQTQRVSLLFPPEMRERGTVIHNGLFSPDIPETVTAFAQRRQKEICAVGRLENGQKAYDVMLEAFALFREKHPEHVLHIYGSGSSEAVIRAQAEALGLADSVMLHGNLPHVIHEIKDMGMFLMTSRYEGMPNALIEAMACGLPCVCTDCDFGPAELIRDGENGLLAPVDDVAAIAAAMGRIADDPVLAEKLSRGALEIRRSHARDTICGQYRDYILSMIEHKG